MSQVALFLISQLARALVGTSTFARVEDTVDRWNKKTISDLQPALTGEDKRKAVIAELEIIGIELEGWLANLLIELAVAKTKDLASKA